MKTRSQAQPHHNAGKSPSQSKTPPDSVRLRRRDAAELEPRGAGAQLIRLLQLDRQTGRALLMVAEWEGLSVIDYARRSVRINMVASFDDLRGFALGICNNARERAWANRFFHELAPLMEQKGLA